MYLLLAQTNLFITFMPSAGQHVLGFLKSLSCGYGVLCVCVCVCTRVCVRYCLCAVLCAYGTVCIRVYTHVAINTKLVT